MYELAVFGRRFCCCFHISSITFSATGIIIPVVAVLLSHIDKNHEGNMKPIRILHSSHNQQHFELHCI